MDLFHQYHLTKFKRLEEAGGTQALKYIASAFSTDSSTVTLCTIGRDTSYDK